jgi:hypothetical protein
MKRKILVSIGLIVVLLQGCIVKSLHPFFNDSDLVARNELINNWTDQDGGIWTINSFKNKPGAYELHWRDKGEQNVVMLGHLFKLNNDIYMDFVPLEDNNTVDMPIFNLHILPTHSVARVISISKDELQIKWFNEKWIRTLFEQNRIKISHEAIPDEDEVDPKKKESDKSYVLTASTEELQKFIIKYGGEDKAFDDENDTLWLKLKRSN